MATGSWLAVRTHLSRTKVAQRLAPLCKGGAQHASGVLQDFWSSVVENCDDGFIRDASDDMLEAWAMWTGRRGAFAEWVRAHHMDENGRVNEWDDWQGMLETRREKARLKKRRQRAAAKQGHEGDNGESHGGDIPARVSGHVPSPVPSPVPGTSPPNSTRQNSTRQYETTDNRSSTTAREKSATAEQEPLDGRQLLLDVLGPSQRKAMAASLAVWAQGYELPSDTPKRAPTDAEISRACREAAASVQAGNVSANLVRRYISTVMRGDPIRPEKNPRSQSRTAGWDDVP